MPVIQSTYKAPYFFRKGFVSTVYSGLFRRINGVIQKRERVNLPDGDFLDLDWSYATEKSNKVIILLHGLEGNAQRPYIIGSAKLFNANGIDAISVNFRGCSGQPNLNYYSYHSGATDDLHQVVLHAISKNYTDIYIKGISLGGNVTLKYLGERNDVPNQIKTAIAISVPCSLKHSAKELHSFKNVLFHDRFKNHLLKSLKLKQNNFPEKLTIKELNSIKTLYDFDTIYTSKAHGFKDADDYYEKCSSLQFLNNIKTPTLILNALNDSFLSPECYPVKEAKYNPHLYLEMPNHGGHVGFIKFGGYYYNELRALDFVQEQSN